MTSERWAVLFDLDGVLIDSGAAHLRSWQALAAEQGVEIPQEKFLATFGQRNADVVPTLFGNERSPEEIAALGDRKEALYRDMVRGNMPRIPGAVDLVQRLAAEDVAMALASSAPRENALLALRELNIESAMGAIVTGEDVSRGKPDPMVFLTAAQRIGVPPERCVVVEDAPPGVVAGVAAGMKVVALASGHPRSALTEAHWVVDALSELTPQRLGELVRG